MAQDMAAAAAAADEEEIVLNLGRARAMRARHCRDVRARIQLAYLNRSLGRRVARPPAIEIKSSEWLERENNQRRIEGVDSFVYNNNDFYAITRITRARQTRVQVITRISRPLCRARSRAFARPARTFEWAPRTRRRAQKGDCLSALLGQNGNGRPARPPPPPALH